MEQPCAWRQPKTLAVSLVALATAALVGACGPTEQEKFRALYQQVNAFKVKTIELQDQVQARDDTIESYKQQLKGLRDRGLAPPEPIFDVDRIAILGLTSGTDLDGEPGDDAVTVYFQPLDQVGDVVKRGGKITVKLFDHSPPTKSLEIGFVHLVSADQIRAAWYGKFWTNHYKIVVPIAESAKLHAGAEVDIYVAFVDAATGRRLTARKAVKVVARKSND